MGLLKKQHRAEKKELKEKEEESKEITKEFLDKFKELREMYNRDFRAELKFLDGGSGGIVPGMRIIDITEQLKAEKKAKEQKENKKQENEK